MEILLASHNRNKKNEMLQVVPKEYQILDLHDLSFDDDIDENGKTLEENALIKVRFLHQKLKLNCIGEDTGLEVSFLNGEPGVFSARYAGSQKNSIDNIELLLKKLKYATNRSAQFRTVIALILNNKEYLFEGIITGNIAESPRGQNGFGYDPVFIPHNYSNTFGELSAEVKSQISHRSIAVNKLVEFLKDQSAGV